MLISLAIILILLLLIVSAGPFGPGWHGQGAWPGGMVGLLLIILLVVILTGY